jgi:hypothetical protein
MFGFRWTCTCDQLFRIFPEAVCREILPMLLDWLEPVYSSDAFGEQVWEGNSTESDEAGALGLDEHRFGLAMSNSLRFVSCWPDKSSDAFWGKCPHVKSRLAMRSFVPGTDSDINGAGSRVESMVARGSMARVIACVHRLA